MAEGFNLRRAGHSDVPGILAMMGDYQVYGGMDYLPATIRHFLHDHSYHVIIAEEGTKIVSLCIYLVHPVGGGVSSLAARTSLAYQSRGLATAVDTYALDVISPNSRREWLSAFYTRLWVKHIPRMTEQAGLIVHRKWKVFMYRCERGRLENLVRGMKRKPEVRRDTVRMSPKHALKMAASNSSFYDVIKMDGDYFQSLNNWQVLPVNEASLKLAVSQSESCVSWDDLVPGSHDDMKAKAVSLASHVPAPGGTRFDLHYYGRDTSACLDHFVTQCAHALCTTTSQKFGMFFHFPLALDWGRIEAALGGYLGPRWTYYEGEDPTEAFTVSIYIPSSSEGKTN